MENDNADLASIFKYMTTISAPHSIIGNIKTTDGKSH